MDGLMCGYCGRHGSSDMKFIFIIFGPTGVGKTACAEHIAQSYPIEIINMDMGQLYTPLTIGTAKPDLQSSSIPHHLFDIIHDASAVIKIHISGGSIADQQCSVNAP